MPNKYATPTNVDQTLGYELIQVLNLPDASRSVVIAAATQLMNGEAISPDLPDEAHTVAATKLFRGCIAVNGQIDTSFRGKGYILPLKDADGNTDPDAVGFYPDIVGAAASLVKWELLKSRPDIRGRKDETEWKAAAKYLGIDNETTSGAASGAAAVKDFTGPDTGKAPRGATVTQIGDPAITIQRRSSMSNSSWIDDL